MVQRGQFYIFISRKIKLGFSRPSDPSFQSSLHLHLAKKSPSLARMRITFDKRGRQSRNFEIAEWIAIEEGGKGNKMGGFIGKH